MKKLCSILLLFTILCSSAACYRMPTADDYSLIPSTNNPDFCRKAGGKGSKDGGNTSGLPAIGY